MTSLIIRKRTFLFMPTVCCPAGFQRSDRWLLSNVSPIVLFSFGVRRNAVKLAGLGAVSTVWGGRPRDRPVQIQPIDLPLALGPPAWASSPWPRPH